MRKKWQKLGVIDLRELIQDNKIQMNQNKIVEQKSHWKKKKDTFLYQGQIDDQKKYQGFCRTEFNDDQIYEGFMKYG